MRLTDEQIYAEVFARLKNERPSRILISILSRPVLALDLLINSVTVTFTHSPLSIVYPCSTSSSGSRSAAGGSRYVLHEGAALTYLRTVIRKRRLLTLSELTLRNTGGPSGEGLIGVCAVPCILEYRMKAVA